MFHRAILRHEFQYTHETSTDVICILVHGTFAPETAWTQDGSSIRRAIVQSLSERSVGFGKFIWRGKANTSFNNTHADRLIAGEILSGSIQSLTSSHPGVQIVLIGHSHGGNVILYALRNLPKRECIRGVVTIATPFLIWEDSDDLIRALAGVPVLFICVICPTLALGYLGLFSQITSPVLIFVIPFASFIGSLLLVSVIATLTGIERWFGDLIRNLQQQHQKYGAPCIDDVPRFSAYVGPDGLGADEAFTWLAFGDWVSRLPRTIMLCIFASPLLLQLFMFIAVPFFGMMPLTALLFLMAGLIAMPAFVRTWSIFFGGESILMNLIGKIEIRAVPPSIDPHSTNVEKGYRAQTWIAHGLYNSTEVIHDVSEWVASRCCPDLATPQSESDHLER